MIFIYLRQPWHNPIIAETAGYSKLNFPIHDIVGGESRPVSAIELFQSGTPWIPSIRATEVGYNLNFIAALTLTLKDKNA